METLDDVMGKLKVFEDWGYQLPVTPNYKKEKLRTGCDTIKEDFLAPSNPPPRGHNIYNSAFREAERRRDTEPHKRPQKTRERQITEGKTTLLTHHYASYLILVPCQFETVSISPAEMVSYENSRQTHAKDHMKGAWLCF